MESRIFSCFFSFLGTVFVPIFTLPSEHAPSSIPIPSKTTRILSYRGIFIVNKNLSVSIMKKVLFAVAVVTFLFMSCSRGLTPYQAANGKAGKCGKNFVR
jgi:hypothetical protein